MSGNVPLPCTITNTSVLWVCALLWFIGSVSGVVVMYHYPVPHYHYQCTVGQCCALIHCFIVWWCTTTLSVPLPVPVYCGSVLCFDSLFQCLIHGDNIPLPHYHYTVSQCSVWFTLSISLSLVSVSDSAPLPLPVNCLWASALLWPSHFHCWSPTGPLPVCCACGPLLSFDCF